MTEGQCRLLVSGTGFSPGSPLPAHKTLFSSYAPNVISNLNSGTKTNFSLPNEAQWEYACRAGTFTAYSFGSDTNQLTNYGWYDANSSNDWKTVGIKLPNAWGLYDMHGNAMETCLSLTNTTYVMRGGDVRQGPPLCRSASRFDFTEGNNNGFRVCLTVPLQLYTVTVSNGMAGAASGTNGQYVAIWVNPPAPLMQFDRWVGDTQTVANVFATNTTLRIPGRNVSVAATYKPTPYTLTLYSGTIATNSLHYGGATSGMFATGDEVPIVADPAPDMQMFDHWRVVPDGVGLGTNFQSGSASTTLTMPSMDLELTAMYTNVPTFTLTVVGGTGSGAYTNGQTVTISAPAPGPHQLFLWTGDTASVADVNAWGTTLVMPAQDITVTATYPPVLYPLTVNGGTGAGAYPFGQVVEVAATNRPSPWHAFDTWLGDTGTVADVFGATTTVTVAGATVLTTSYRPIPVPTNTYLVVDLGASQTNTAVSYLDAVPEGGWTEEYLTDKLVLRRLVGGTFVMGSAPGETDRLDESQHNVTLTKVFYIGLFEVTQGQWQKLMGTWPSYYSNEEDRATHPVERVTYVDIRGSSNGAKWPASAAVDSGSFIGLLRAKTGEAAFDLPTEAQWEYACRAGTTGAYAGTLGDLAVYSGNSGGQVWAVGQKAPNPWGLYDMHGNVDEICLDWYADDYSTTNQIDPRGAVGSVTNRRIMRGGAYAFGAEYCRSAYRGNLMPTNAFPFAGLRVARTAGPLYPLTVIDGAVNTGGLYLAGTPVPVSALRKGAGAVFSRWSVQPANAKLGAWFATNRADTVVTMPTNGVVLTALYTAEPNTTALMVTGGSGSGNYTNGQAVAISADPPPAWYIFDRWTGDTAGVASVTSAVTTVWMGGGIVSLTATYRPRDDLPADVNWLQVIGNGETNSQLLQAGTQVAVSAPAAPAGRVFGWWTLSPSDADLGGAFDIGAASTTLAMPAYAVSISANYVPDPGSTPGTVRVRLIDQSGADVAGATWSPDGGKNWYPAGLCPLKPASYTLRFLSPGVNWVAPANARVTVRAGQTSEVTGTYQWVPAVGDGATPFAMVGVAFAAAVDIGIYPATFSGKNLPSGLSLNSKTGVISGVPKKVGSYVVSVTAKGSDGTVASGTIYITVEALPALAQGSFTGYVGTDLVGTNRTVDGLFTMSVSTVGRITAKVTLQKASTSFSGASWAKVLPGGIFTVALRTSKGETLNLAVDSADGALAGSATNGAFGAEGLLVAGMRNPYLNKADAGYPAATNELSRFKAYYTVSLPVLACVSDGLVANEQAGAGYLTLTVKDKGAVALAGKLAEGTSFSASATLLSDGVDAFVPVFVPLYSKRGVLSGLLTLSKGDSAPASNRVELCGGVPLDWAYPGKSTSQTEDRFTVSAEAIGAYYDSLINLQAHYEGTSLTAEEQVWEVPLSFKSSGAAYLASGTNNPASATLSVTSRTGLFSGSFKVGTSSLRYYGVLTRDGGTDIGLGSYVAPQTVSPYKAKPSFEVVIE